MKVNANRAIEFLLARGNLPILYWLKKDILDVPIDREQKNLQKYAARIRILESQRPNGGWCRRNYEGHPHWENTHYIVESLRNAIRLYDYGCTSELSPIQDLAKFLFSTQSPEGDFRGAYLNEYAPTYHALTLEILCQFGINEDKRVEKGFRWLIKNRQDDGGWVIPYRTIEKNELKSRYNYDAQLKLDPVKPDKSMPFSHLVTGMVLRSFASSPLWKKSKEAKCAGELLASRFFKEDQYEDRRQASYWEDISYPFWATDILSGLDSLAKIGFEPQEPSVQNALSWLSERQNEQGYWASGLKKSTLEDHLWVTLSILRIFKNFGLLEL